MVDIDWTQLWNPDPQHAWNNLVKLGQGARNFTCGLYHDFPQWMTGADTVASGPYADAQRSFLDSLCKDQLPPPFKPPAPPFQGGQCSTLYHIVVQVQGHSAGGQLAMGFQGNAQGPIAHILMPDKEWVGGSEPPTIKAFDTNYNLVGQMGHDPSLGMDSGVFPSPGQNGFMDTFSVLSLTRVDGQPDNCGSLPPPPPTPPPDNRKNGNVTIVNNDGTTYIIPVSIGNINLPGSVVVNAGTGLNINFNFGGATINIGGDVDNSTLNNNINNVNNTVNSISGVVNNTNNIVIGASFGSPGVAPTYPPPTGSGGGYKPTQKQPSDPKTVKNVPKLGFVSVTLTAIPANRREQKGDGAPDVIYAGWFEFKLGDFSFPRQPIHFQENVFASPPGSDGYAYTLYSGFDGYATEFTIDASA